MISILNETTAPPPPIISVKLEPQTSGCITLFQLNDSDTSRFACLKTSSSELFPVPQTLHGLHGGRHLWVWRKFPGALHQVQLLQRHLRQHERRRPHRLLDLHLRTKEHLLQRGLQGERRDSAGTGEG